jgi:hypothetical protein
MRKLLQLAALLALATPAHAQIRNPDTLVAPPPRNPARTEPQPIADYQWLWQYAKSAPDGQKSALLADPRFISLLKENLQTPQAFWGSGVPLSDAASIFLAGEGRVISFNNRYLVITGCVVDQCEQRGLLWIDLASPHPLIVFAALRWTESAKTPDQPGALFDLWLFPNRNIDPEYFPSDLRDSLRDWTLQPDFHCDTYKKFGTRLAAIVDIDGTPHVQPLRRLGVNSYDCIDVTNVDPVITKRRKK